MGTILYLRFNKWFFTKFLRNRKKKIKVKKNGNFESVCKCDVTINNNMLKRKDINTNLQLVAQTAMNQFSD